MKPKKSATKKVVGPRNLHIAGGLISGYLRRGNQKATMSSSSSLQVAKNIGATATINTKSFLYTCAGCERPIRRDKFLLKACDKYWHENCLKCDRCNGKLGELGSTLYCKSNMNLCRQDYLELFGETGVCSVCEKVICASEMVMRAKKNVYHLECFACQLCSQRFCVGDRFYLCENKVICQYDYEEHILPIQRSLEQEHHEHASIYQSQSQSQPQPQPQSQPQPQPPPPHALSSAEPPHTITYLDSPGYHLNPTNAQLNQSSQMESEVECRTLLTLINDTTKSIPHSRLVSELDKVEVVFGGKPLIADGTPESIVTADLKMEPKVSMVEVKSEETS